METFEVEILLIEDNPNDAEMAIRALKKNKLANKLVHLSDGAKALDFLFGKGEFEERNINNRPRMILLDLKMPKVDGIEVLTIIKQDEMLKKIPVIVLSSSSENPDLEICYKLGANSFIVKPIDFDNFQKAVSEVGLYWMVLNQLPA